MVEGARKQEIAQTQDLEVKTVSKDQFDELVTAAKEQPLIKIPQNEWRKTTGVEPIENKGAGPCLIIYVRDKKTGEVISGHFPEVLKERQDKFIRTDLKRMAGRYSAADQVVVNPAIPPQIELPNPADIARLSHVHRDESYENFVNLVEQVEAWVKKDQDQQIEVQLFGQNFLAFGEDLEAYMGRIVKGAKGQQDLKSIFIKLGISGADIHDHRVIGEDNVDDTFYSAQEKTIYHTLREHKVDNAWRTQIRTRQG